MVIALSERGREKVIGGGDRMLDNVWPEEGAEDFDSDPWLDDEEGHNMVYSEWLPNETPESIRALAVELLRERQK